MPKLKILTGENSPILRAVSQPVEKFDRELADFAEDLRAAMVAAKGIGIAAAQVGRGVRLFWAVFNHGKADEVVVVMVNPEIVSHGTETEMGEEGCLSLPGIYGKVERFKSVKVKFFDLSGNTLELELNDLNARIVQHENDHLNGVLFIDRVKEMEERKGLAF